ncbi:MAG: MarR family transcriptional regulator [Armatimonas sp.]
MDPTRYTTYWINQASRLLVRQFEEVLRPHGLGMAYLPVISALESGPKTQSELLQSIPVSQPTLTALLKRMERDGVITREAKPGDRRASLLHLTEQALTNLPAANAAMLDVAKQAMTGLSETDESQLQALLKTVCQNLER